MSVGDRNSRRALIPEVTASVLAGLPVRPARRPDEPRSGHWLRVADANGLREPTWLLVGPEKRALAVVRICPRCLSRPAPLWHAAWLDREHPYCANHGIWLVDQCDQCGKLLRWSRVRYLCCRCGKDLRDIPTISMNRDEKKALVVDGTPLHVLLWLGSLAIHGLTAKPLKKASRCAQAGVVELAREGARTACDWPIAFLRTLDSLRLDGPGDDRLLLLNDALSGLTRRIRRLRRRDWQTRVSQALGIYAQASDRTDTPVVGRNLPSARQATAHSVAQQLGIRVERLLAALDVVTGTEVATRRTATGRLRRLFSEEAIAQVRGKIQDEISIKQASRMLGLTIARVRGLVSSGRLKQGGLRLSRREVEQLISAIQSRARAGTPPADAIELAWAWQYIIPRDQTDLFFASLLAGDLTLHRRAGTPHLPHLLVSKNEVHDWRDIPRAWFTIPELAERLHLKQQVVYHLVRVGLIPSDKVLIASRPTQIVAADAVYEFERSFETLSQRVSREGIDPRQGLRFATATDIELISGPRIDGGRQYFVHREPG